MKQEKRRVQTITLLIETTKQLIEQKSCHLITLQDIMNGSGLSKGAIFHYIKSKDELFVWVLRERLEETNERFMNEINEGRQTFEQPMQQIKETIETSSFSKLNNKFPTLCNYSIPTVGL